MSPENLQTAASPSSEVLLSVPEGVSFITLPNGLQLIVREDRSAPVVSAQLWCRAGSIDEGRWLGAGLSHVLEHMLFKGTPTRAVGQIEQEVQDAGGYINAYTSFDRTVYWISAPNTGATVAVDILCDIAQHASLPADELAKELDVIRREMSMCWDDPGRRSSRRLFETAYHRSPYRFPVIGLPDIFNRLTRDDIAGYYAEKYSPNNLFFVVVGDVRPDDVVAQITKAFSGTTARPMPSHPLVGEPRQTSPRELVEEAPVELAHVHLAWHIPDVRHPDVPVLDVLSTLLGSGHSSRLYQSVRERAGLVHQVGAWTYSPGQAGLLGISAAAEGTKFMAARTAILAEVERVRGELVTERELAKAVKQFTAGTLAARKTMEGQAQDLGGNWLAANDLSFSERYLAAVRQVTAEDIRRVAREYLSPENRTVTALLPEGTAPRSIISVASHSEQATELFTLPNGLRLLIKQDHRLPFVEFRAVFLGGVLAETAATNGVTSLMSRMLVKGTRTRTAEEIAGEIENVGGSLDTYAGNNSVGISAEVLREDFETGLHLIADVLRNPAWPAGPLERERDTALASIRHQRDQLLQHAFKLARRGLFGATAYGLDQLGTEQVVSNLTAAELARIHADLVTPANGVLAIFGDVKAPEVRRAIDQALGDWRSAAPGFHPPESVSPVTASRLVEPRDKEQAVVVLAFPGSTLMAEDREALELLQEVCSDMGSRLFLRIRDELGLAYYVGASNFPGLVPGYFAFYCGTAPEKADEVERELRAQVEALRREGVTSGELARAKAKVIGQKKIARQDLGQLAMTMALDELYGLGFANIDREDARYQAVTLEGIHAAAAKYLRSEKAVAVILQGKPVG